MPWQIVSDSKGEAAGATMFAVSAQLPSGRFAMIDDAMTDQDLRVPPNNHFEKPRGNLDRRAGIRSTSTNNGGWFSNGMAVVVKRRVSMWMITGKR